MIDRTTWGETLPLPEPPRISDACSLVSRLLIVAVILFALFCATGCTTTTATAPDGAVTVTKAPAPGVLPFAGAAIRAYSPRAIIVREEKSAATPDDLRRILRGRQITPQEIANHRKP
jgi:hypothetical protein